MSSIRVAVGIIFVVLALVARGMWAETGVRPPFHVDYGRGTTAISEPMELERAPFGEGIESHRVDRYGNPIETAIGDYRIDWRGEIYERHSPDTAVLRLGAPGT